MLTPSTAARRQLVEDRHCHHAVRLHRCLACSARLRRAGHSAYGRAMRSPWFRPISCVLVAVATLLLGPAASAQAGAYVSVGDSYSAGEGAGSYDRRSLWCHRSKNAWPRIMGVRKEHHLACSGAKIANVLSKPQRLAPELRPQLHRLNAISEKTDIDTVVLTLGGNDLKFASKIASCRIAIRSCLTDRARIDRELADVRPKLTDAYERIYASAQARRLAVVGYPDIIPNPGEATVRCGWLKTAKRDNIEYLQEQLDETLRSAAAAAGAIYISVRDALRSDDLKVGHELCTKNSWMYPLTRLRALDPTRTSRSEWQQQGHPTKDGQRAIATHVRRGLANWEALPGQICSREGPNAMGDIVTLYAHLVSCDTAAQTQQKWLNSPYNRDRLRGGWRCRIIGGTPNTDHVPEVRCESNGRIVRWTNT